MAIVESNVLAQLRKFDSATLFNAVCELSGEPNLNYTDHTIRCLLPGLGSAIGYAITAEFSTNDADSTTLPWHEYYEHMEASEGPLIAAIRDVVLSVASYRVRYGISRVLAKWGCQCGLGVQYQDTARSGWCAMTFP